MQKGYSLNTNVPAGTAGTTATDVVSAANVVALPTSPGETVYVRTDTPIARDQNIRFASKLVKAYIPPTGTRDPNANDVSILAEISEVWDTTADNPNGYVYPAKAHIVIRVPHDADVTLANVTGLLARLLGYVADNSTKMAELLRLKTDVL